MEKELRVEAAFYRGGKFVGGSFVVFTGDEDEINSAFAEGGEKLTQDILECMADRAGVKKYNVVSYNYVIDDSSNMEEE